LTFGPGTNYFSHLADRVWVDASDQLHLTLKNVSGTWSCTEVVAEQALGYGDYIVTAVGRLDLIDIEYSRWGNPTSGIAQFVAQPFDYPGNITRFNPVFGAGEVTSHAMRWLHDKIEYRVWRGGPSDESPANLIAAWTYTGPHIPRPESPRLHLNLWKLTGTPAANQEVVFKDFTFMPEGAISAVPDDNVRGLPAIPAGRLHGAVPNPFNPQTTVRFELDRAGAVRLDVFDLEGRRVRTLVNGQREAGAHEAQWDGRDAAGKAVASGVYLFQLRGSDFTDSRQATLVR